MKYYLFTIYFFLFSITLFTEYKKPLRTQVELKNIILNQPIKNVINKKKLLFSIFYYSQKLKNEQDTFIFFEKLLKKTKYRPLLSAIYYNMSMYKSGEDRKRLLLNAKNSSLDNMDLKLSLLSLVDFYKNNFRNGKRYLELFYLKKLINIQNKTNDFSGLEKSFFNAGVYYKERIDYLNSINYFAKSIVYSKKVKGTFKGNSYLEIANIFYLIDKKNLTKKFLSKALDFSNNSKDKKLLSYIYLFYSKDYYDKKLYDKALKYILKAEYNLEYKNSSHRKELFFLKSKILFNLDQKDKSKSILKHIIHTEIKTGSFKNFLHIISYYTEILINENKLIEAETNILKINDIYAPYYRYYYYYYYLKALLFEKSNNKKYALIYYNRTLKSIEEIFKNSTQDRYFYFKEDIDRIYKRISVFTISLNEKKLIKKIIYLNELKHFTNRSKIQTKNYNSYSIKKVKEFLFNDEKKNVMDQEQRKIIKEINKLDSDFLNSYKRFKFSNLKIEKIQRRLLKNQLLIKYIIVENDLYAVYITRKKYDIVKKKEIMSELHILIKSFSNTLDDFTMGNVDYLRVQFKTKVAKKLYNILLKTILEKNDKTMELLIIPDEILFKIPFETLIVNNKKRIVFSDILFSQYKNYNYLIEKYSISYYFSIFQFLNNEKNIYKKKTYKLLFYGDPLISKNMRSVFLPLPSTNFELNSIKRLFTKMKILSFTKKDLTISNFKKYSSKTDIIHIATHYVKNAEFPFYSSFLFSNDKGLSNSCFAHNIYNSKLNNSLVVLSACESSENNLIGINGLNGIVAAFKNAGTKSIIVSLWPVDEYNSTLLPIFYKYLNKYKSYSKSAISNALRFAKLEFIKKINIIDKKLKISYSHPYLWSNFIIYNLN